MITALVNRVKSIPAPSKTNEPSADDLEDRLHVLELSAKVLYILVNLVKVRWVMLSRIAMYKDCYFFFQSFDKKQVLAIVLKVYLLSHCSTCFESGHYFVSFFRMGESMLMPSWSQECQFWTFSSDQDRWRCKNVYACMCFITMTVRSAFKTQLLDSQAFLCRMIFIFFSVAQDDVIALLKTVQQSTRCLHHFCGHSKVEKDTRLVNHIPQLKKSLEILVFRVKVLFFLRKDPCINSTCVHSVCYTCRFSTTLQSDSCSNYVDVVTLHAAGINGQK